LNILVTCRHEYKTDDVKNYAMEKAGKLSRFSQNITKIEVVLNSEKEQHSAEALISVSRGGHLKGSVTQPNIHAAIDLLVDKMERQLIRFKERMKDHRGTRRNESTGRTDTDDI